ncbi:MAG: hypothetical protein OHK0017_01470 [Patescibacteria group bacterium]
MTSTDIQPEISQKVLQQINDKKLRPKSRVYFISLDILIGVALFLTFFTASFLISLYVYDLFSYIWPLDPMSVFDLRVLSASGVEFLILAIALMGLVWLIYRQTDWPLVRRTVLVGILVALLALTVSMALLQALAFDQVNQFFNGSLSNLKSLIRHEGRNQIVGEKLLQNGISIGKITDVRTTLNPFDGVKVKRLKAELSYPVSQAGQTVEFTSDLDLKIGDLVKISVQKDKIISVEKVVLPYKYKIEIIYSSTSKLKLANV